MKQNKNVLSIGFKVKTISSLVLLASLFFLTLLSVYTIDKMLLKSTQDYGVSLVKQFANQIEMSNATISTLDQQLDDKLKSVSYSLANNNNISNDYLTALGKKIGVAEIDFTGPDRKIIYSNISENLGWSYPESHPADPLFKGTKKEIIEDIRQSKTDKKYYKYGEIILENGGIIQVGISADDIQKMKSSIEPQSIIKTISKNSNIVYARIIGKDLKIAADSDVKNVGTQVNSIGTKTSAVDEKTYTNNYLYDAKNVTVYEVAVPLYKDGKHIGALDVGLSLESLNAAKKQLVFQSSMIALVFFLIGVICFTFLISNIIKPIQKLVKAAKTISEGNLDQQIIVKNNDEVGILSASFNNMILNLKEMISGIHSASSTVSEYSNELVESFESASAVSEEIAATAQNMSENSKINVKETKNVTTNIKDALENITIIKEEIKTLVTSSDETSNLVLVGNSKIQDMSNQMDKIKTSVNLSSDAIYVLESISNEIGNIVEIINEIATQTNLLALNASIEAARAGESGKGFAVVADEVRTLAEKSIDSAEGIKNLIVKTQENTKKALKSIQNGTEEVAMGETTVKEVKTFMKNILDASTLSKNKLHNTNNKLTAIYESTEKIYGNIDEIDNISNQSSTNIFEISESIQKQSEAMGKISLTTQKLMDMIYELNGVIDKFNSDK